MALDITAYANLILVENPVMEDGWPVEDLAQAWENPDFPGRISGLTAGGFYRTSDKPEDSIHVYFGYGGYYNWRNLLAKLAGYPATPMNRYGTITQEHIAGAWGATEGPFWELINFSDCEGTIGPVVSAKLLADFDEFLVRATSVSDDRFYTKYAEMRRVFALGVNGMVKFA